MRAARRPCMLGPMSDMTRLLDAAKTGDRKAADLVPVADVKLHTLAAAPEADQSVDPLTDDRKGRRKSGFRRNVAASESDSQNPKSNWP
jgi:hypothetical protein